MHIFITFNWILSFLVGIDNRPQRSMRRLPYGEATFWGVWEKMSASARQGTDAWQY